MCPILARSLSNPIAIGAYLVHLNHQMISPQSIMILHLVVVVVATEVVLDVLWWALVGVVLILAAIVLVIQLFAAALGLVLGPLAVDVVGALGLGEFVDLSTGEACEQLLGELVGDWLAWRDECQYLFFSTNRHTGRVEATYPPFSGGPRRP